MMNVVFIKPTFPFFTVGKIYPAHKLDTDRVSIRADDGEQVSSDIHDLLFESTDEIHG